MEIEERKAKRRQNFVAKHLPKFNKPKIHKPKIRYSRKQKYKEAVYG